MKLNVAQRIWIVALAAMPVLAFSQEKATSEYSVTGVVEGGVGHANISDPYPNWNDQYLKSGIQLTAADRIAAEFSHQAHFGDGGFFFALGYTRTWDDRWFSFLSAGTSTGGFFLPRVRVDACVSRKWFENKSLVTNVGLGYYRAKDVHFDLNLVLSAVYYFTAPWIVEVGGRVNDSNPGNAFSLRGFSAVTFGYNQRYYFTFKYEGGQESYQLVGANAAINDFISHEVSFIWRQWIVTAVGFNMRITYYNGPYERTGVEAGIFVEF